MMTEQAVKDLKLRLPHVSETVILHFLSQVNMNLTNNMYQIWLYIWYDRSISSLYMYTYPYP